MKFRVKYYKDMGKWMGEVQDDDTTLWLMKTDWRFTKYNAKRELRKWYKRETAPEKVEEVDPVYLNGGGLIDILKPLLIGLAVVCFAVFICAKYL